MEKKIILRPFLKRKEVRVGLGSLSSFVVPGTSGSARVRIVLPRPSAAMSIRKRSLSRSMHTPSLPSTYAFLLYPISSIGRPALDVKQSTRIAMFIKIKPSSGYFMSLKIHEYAYNRIWFFKNFPGEHAPVAPSGARASPNLFPSVRNLTGA